MKRPLLLIVIILFSFGISAQEMPISTKISIQKNNHTLQAYIQPFDKKPFKPQINKEYHFYYHNNIQQLRGDYMGDLLNGKYQELNDQHRLIKAGNFEQGVKCGDWKEWDKNGELRSLSHYKKGNLHGKLISFSQNGKQANVEIYKKGKATGKNYVIENLKFLKEAKKEKEKKVKKEKSSAIKSEKAKSDKTRSKPTNKQKKSTEIKKSSKSRKSNKNNG